MRSNMMAMAALAGMGMFALSAAPMEPSAEPEPGSARNRSSGSKPVAGGGARERARRLARMAETKESN